MLSCALGLSSPGHGKRRPVRNSLDSVPAEAQTEADRNANSKAFGLYPSKSELMGASF
jgi:hypothetical protein